MTKRIFRTIFTVAVTVFLASALLFMTALYDYFSGAELKQLGIQTSLAARGVENEGSAYFDGLEIENYRITWIGTDGSVLYDSASDANGMENHFQREEVKEALAEGYGTSSRYSPTLMQRYLYSAKRLSDGTVLRLSVAHNSLLLLTFGMIQPITVIFFLAVILSAVLASRLSKNIVKPFNSLDLDKPLDNDGYDELSPILRRIDAQQREIKRQSDALKRRKTEFDVMTSSMPEGIVLLDKKGEILSINRAAIRLFQTDADCVGRDIVTVCRNISLHEVLERAKDGKSAEASAEFGGRSYQLNANPVITEGEMRGTVLLMLDITEKEQAEQMRREFTANVSHELKTPLHTISGSAELIANGMVKQADIPNFAAKIYDEAQRMICLVEDIIRLSHLDEGAQDMTWQSVELLSLARSAADAVSDAAERAGVSVSLDGESVTVWGVSQLLESVIFNICDNAVKYNRPGGSVHVTVRPDGGRAVIRVSDTGIGISEEERERVFERFYRVDKSRSREIGGTGLGLSIVKHAVRLHGGEISLHSVPNEGTEITVTLKRQDI